MKPQQAEFQFPPVSHTHDPTSSKEAEKQITQSGRRQTDANRVLAVLTLSPGKTATEIGEELWPEDLRGQIGKARRRLSDLKFSRKVYNRIRVDEDGKNERESRWWPVRE